MTKRFEERRTDFGVPGAIAPPPMRLMMIQMPNGDKWRVELEPDEKPTKELKSMLEEQANIWVQTTEILHGIDFQGGEYDGKQPA